LQLLLLFAVFYASGAIIFCQLSPSETPPKDG